MPLLTPQLRRNLVLSHFDSVNEQLGIVSDAPRRENHHSQVATFGPGHSRSVRFTPETREQKPRPPPALSPGPQARSGLNPPPEETAAPSPACRWEWRTRDPAKTYAVDCKEYRLRRGGCRAAATTPPKDPPTHP